MNHYNDSVRITDTLSSLADSREFIRSKLEQMQLIMTEIQQEYKKHSEYTLSFKNNISDYRSELDMDELLKGVDRTFWKIALDISQVEKFISSAEKADMNTKLYDAPPTFDEVSARKMIDDVMNSTNALATNLVKKVYADIVNTPFFRGNNYRAKRQAKNKNKVEKSFRVSMFSRYGLPSYVHHNDKNTTLIQDLERVCYLLDDKLQPVPQNNIVALLSEALRDEKNEVDGPYFKLTLFKNGNVKIDFKDKAILDRLNLWGSKGRSLPDFT